MLVEAFRSMYEDLPGTTILVAHSEGVAGSSFAFGADASALSNVFDGVVLVNGAAAEEGAFERYIDAGRSVMVVADAKTDVVVACSRKFVPALGDLQSTLDIDDAWVLAVPGAGHSGPLTPDTESSTYFGEALVGFVNSSGSGYVQPGKYGLAFNDYGEPFFIAPAGGGVT